MTSCCKGKIMALNNEAETIHSEKNKAVKFEINETLDLSETNPFIKVDFQSIIGQI